jgi:hypothetical protein
MSLQRFWPLNFLFQTRLSRDVFSSGDVIPPEIWDLEEVFLCSLFALSLLSFFNRLITPKGLGPSTSFQRNSSCPPGNLLLNSRLVELFLRVFSNFVSLYLLYTVPPPRYSVTLRFLFEFLSLWCTLLTLYFLTPQSLDAHSLRWLHNLKCFVVHSLHNLKNPE